MGLGAAALFLIAAVAVASDDTDAGDNEAASWGGTLVDPPLARPSFTLTDTEGRPYDFRVATAGRLTLLFFGYTNCPDVCPIQMRTLDATLDTPGMPPATVVFVTTDPQRDTPERLRSWLDDMDRDFVGLTGSREEIATAEQAAQVVGSMVAAEANDGAEDYEVGHAAQVVAYTPDDQAHVLYPFGVRREDWAADLPRMLELWGTPPDAGADDGQPGAAGNP